MNGESNADLLPDWMCLCDSEQASQLKSDGDREGTYCLSMNKYRLRCESQSQSQLQNKPQLFSLIARRNLAEQPRSRRSRRSRAGGAQKLAPLPPSPIVAVITCWRVWAWGRCRRAFSGDSSNNTKWSHLICIFIGLWSFAFQNLLHEEKTYEIDHDRFL